MISSIYSVNKVYTYLAKIIFWNMILRMFLEGYMEYAITSLINIYNVIQYLNNLDVALMGHKKQLFFICIFYNDFHLDVHISFPGLVLIVEKFRGKTTRTGICRIVRIHIYGIKNRIEECFDV